MNTNRAYTEMLIIAVAAFVVLLVSMASAKAPVAKVAAAPVAVPAASQTLRVASPLQAADLHTVSAQTAGQWVRADAQDTTVQQTRWVF